MIDFSVNKLDPGVKDAVPVNPQLDLALSLLRAGLSVIPIPRDGSKFPNFKWGKHASGEKDQQGNIIAPGRPATEVEARNFWSGTRPPGLAVCCGLVSGNVEVMDFDAEAQDIFPAFA